ncbi:MAG: endonuclease/exonuclease/phosphatase family protein [Deltaproteobacteria bacterium]|jgi:endonuclease/exonuclease/phosphatase family metal-dependent hydrolase|nr:endonuclease/exonuclease/phosphatase family protein [Deltaproteobacteria bacterium]
MKKPIIICLAAVFCIVCTPPAHTTDSTVTIASFNIQVFGKTKAGKPAVMEVLADMITRFDVVAIQEIRNKSGTAIVKLESEVDALGSDYAVITGPRLGRTTSKEQYAFMYRTSTIEPVGDTYTYKEPGGTDPFHREPFIGKFRSRLGRFDFVLITVHTDPDEATAEICSLDTVLDDARIQYPDEGDFIILGDLNADCRYYNESEPNPIPGTLWLIPDTADTTVKSTVCTYDRIIITSEADEDHTGTSEVYRFDTVHDLTNTQAAKVSDHYPVYAEFFTYADTD